TCGGAIHAGGEIHAISPQTRVIHGRPESAARENLENPRDPGSMSVGTNPHPSKLRRASNDGHYPTQGQPTKAHQGPRPLRKLLRRRLLDRIAPHSSARPR